MYLNGLDGLDREIVRLLIENARISYSDIGEEIGISRVAVKARIQALEQKGIIEGYTTIINPQKISGAVSCYFEIEAAPDSLSRVTEILNAEDTVTQIYRVTGKDDLKGVLEEAMAHQGPVVIDCQIDRDDKVFPMVPAGAAIEEVFDQDDLKK